MLTSYSVGIIALPDGETAISTLTIGEDIVPASLRNIIYFAASHGVQCRRAWGSKPCRQPRPEPHNIDRRVP